ncbi:MAG: serine/threonine protein phosphatase [Oscillospiraceae bacterium]|nr:serine/threonine protein phosphatase [Oscillospiraceae bacterium]
MRGLKREKAKGGAAAAVQLRDGGAQPFGVLRNYVPLGTGETQLYRAIREAVPVVDAAIYKLVRLTGGLQVRCGEASAEQALREFLRTVPAGRGQYGFNAFMEQYLDSLLTCGRAVGEIVPSGDGREIAALLCARPELVEVCEGDNPLEFTLCMRTAGQSVPFAHQELLLFTPLNPETEHPYGVSLLRSMPFLTELLLKIYYAMGQNWERCGNVRFAVTYKPQGEELEHGQAQERAEQIAREWSSAMQSGRDGTVRDFVSVGDVSIKAIGADNQIPDSEVPVRQILEQLIAKTGLPPFMLGLNWSSTERMSSQQADMLTTELTALRRTLTPVAERICRLWLRLHGYGCHFEVVWDDINLQDEVEEARAALLREQARRLKIENDGAEEEHGDQ